ncbi:hypothetical protein CP969_27485 [Streptomyces viridosporus T7A]|uniref:Secreted protein n=1 Tax=Streptomyces viridosporus T7A TaxID=665577 RepID=A0ABX6AJJ4_STRVD|nr:hypothetical protein CP969_27485 [Streptomyces viridosporus T7A]
MPLAVSTRLVAHLVKAVLDSPFQSMPLRLPLSSPAAFWMALLAATSASAADSSSAGLADSTMSTMSLRS